MRACATSRTTRRSFLGRGAASGITLMSGAGWSRAAAADTTVTLPLPGGPQIRAMTSSFPQKAEMILQRTRPPLLETPFAVFDRGVFTPNDAFFVRWHWAVIPTDINVDSFRLAVTGHVDTPLSLTLRDIVDGLPKFELAAVNQCSGNSRGFTEPPVAGAQWANGAMGNAKWLGVRLKDVLDRAGVRAGAQRVRFSGMDDPVVAGAPKFMKSLALDHAQDGEVMIAYAMNGEQLPLLNGFPLRLVVPGWFSTYWVKMLDRIEVLDRPDDNFWTANAYLVPDTPGADMKPGQANVRMVPISKMVPRSFITNLTAGAVLKSGTRTLVRGIAFGGSTGVKSVEVSLDGGATWLPTTLGRDEGKYSFRQWQVEVAPALGETLIKVRCTNTDEIVQPAHLNWNPGGFMHNAIETLRVTVT